MNKLQQGLAALTVLATVSGASMVYADTSGSTSASTQTTTSSTIPVDSGFNLIYQKNQQREAALLLKAQQGQSPYASQFSGFVTSVGAQVATLYASEEALTQLGLTWGKDVNGNPSQNLLKKEAGLQLQLRNAEKQTKGEKGKGKSTEKQELKLASSIQQQLKLVHSEIKLASKIDFRSPAKSFAQNVASLRRTILGLQADEIRVTQAWIASESVAGSVYGDNTSSNTDGSVTVQLSGGVSH